MTNIEDHPLPPKEKGYTLIIVLSLILIGLFVFGIVPRFFTWAELREIADDNSLPIAKVMHAKPEKKPLKLTLPSVTTAMHLTPIWARVDGYLANFFVDIGDRVVKNQLLALIETPELDKQLLQAKADLLKAEAELNIAKITSDRWRELYQKNQEAVPKQEVDEREANYATSKANVESFAANVQRLQKTLEFKNITAPFDGVITERHIDIGSLITAGSTNNPQQLFAIAEMDIIRVFVYVPQYFYRMIKDGMFTDVTIEEFPDRVFKGKVIRNSKALDQTSRTLLTEIHINNKSGLLTTGLYATVNFELIPTKEYFIIPTSSLIIIDEGPKVAIVDPENKIKMVSVLLGRDYGKTIELTSGINENDQIILNPTAFLHEGMEVKVQEPKPNQEGSNQNS